MSKVLVIHGPNLNLLGRREPDIYGQQTLEEINQAIRQKAQELGLSAEMFQSNHEGDLVDRIQEAAAEAEAIIINPGAFTHYSIALRDAIQAARLPTVEVHLTNIYGREEFRQTSVTAGACVGLLAGFGVQSYLLALEAVAHLLGGKQAG